MPAARLRSVVPRRTRRRVGSFVRALRAPGDVPRPRLVTGPLRVLPDFLVIGAAKSGTSSLFYALKQHPAVLPPSDKELEYFDVWYANGVDWYRAHFPTVRDRVAGLRRGTGFRSFEATPAYLFHPHAARRAAATVPGAQIVAILRDPVERAYSHWQHHRRDGRETLSFEEAVEREDERIGAELDLMRADEWYYSPAVQTFSYLARGRYAEQLEEWLRWFPRDHVLVLRSEDLDADPAGTYRKLTRFLDLPDWQPGRHVRRNEGGYGDDMAPATRARLEGHFEPANRHLALVLGTDVWWS